MEFSQNVGVSNTCQPTNWVSYHSTIQAHVCTWNISVCVHVFQTSYLAQLIANGKVRKGKIKEVDWKERKREKKEEKKSWNDKDETKQNLLFFLPLILQLISAVHLPFLFTFILPSPLLTNIPSNFQSWWIAIVLTKIVLQRWQTRLKNNF